ncbi:hypothetical protein [Micromonospora sp. NPDC002717]|uniref:hypothetical protein n=1 Tax=Micromonospora sp. NPDC002717 TaxID=3154424 RepID=UPI0033327B1E
MEFSASLRENAIVRFSSRWIILAGCGIFGIGAITLGLSTLSVAYEAPPGAERPKVTDWMQGWGSVIGVISAIIAAALTALLLIHEMGEARRARAEAAEERKSAAEDRAELAAQRDDERKTLARFIMTGKPQVTVVDKKIGKGQVLLAYLSVSVHNTGTVPARDVVAEIKISDDPLLLAKETFELFLPDPPPVPSESGIMRGFPTDRVRRVSTAFDTPRVVSAQALRREALIFELRFTDANGRRWRRVNNGDPVSVTPEEVENDRLPLEIHRSDPLNYKGLDKYDQDAEFGQD